MIGEPGNAGRTRPLRGHVVLVLGAGGSTARAVALHLAAMGAAVIAAGPALADVVVTAGLIAAAGGTVRVIETPAPPCLGDALARLATEALETPTSAVVAEDLFPSREAAGVASRELSPHLFPGAPVLPLRAARNAGEERAAIETVVAALTPPGTGSGAAESSARR